MSLFGGLFDWFKPSKTQAQQIAIDEAKNAAAQAAAQAALAAANAKLTSAGYAWLASKGYTLAQVAAFFVPQANAAQAVLKLSSGGLGQISFTAKATGTQRSFVTSPDQMATTIGALLSDPNVVSIDSVGPLV